MKHAGAKGQGRDRRVLSGLESWQRLCVASSSLLSTKRYLEGSVQAGVESLKIGGRPTEGSGLSAGAAGGVWWWLQALRHQRPHLRPCHPPTPH